MDNNSDSKSWFHSVPGILTGVAAVVGAVTTLFVTLSGGNGQSNVEPPSVDDCAPPYVWRLAVPSDHVCVTEDSRKQVEIENQRAAERRQVSGGGAYGPDTCLDGYVWREAFEGDTVRVLPERRAQVRTENARQR